jgi:DNA polymerase-1
MIETEKEFIELCIDLRTSPFVAVDTETDGNDCRDGSGYLMGISVATYDRAEYLPFRHSNGENLPIHWRDRLAKSLSSTLIFHNAKFDIPSLATIGIPVEGKFYDTMLMAHMVNENYPSKALDSLGRTLLGEGKARDDKFKRVLAAFGWAEMPVSVMRPYAEQDARLTYKLFEYLYPLFKKEGFDGELWDTEQAFSRLLIDMESNGIAIDRELCASESAVGRDSMAKCVADLGFNPGSTTELGDYLLNVMQLPVVGVTPTGAPSFDKAAMAKYDVLLEASNDPTAKLVKKYRGWQKACAVAYEGYPKLVSGDGRLRPNFKMHGTVTGRLSCEQPNLQQIPRSSSNVWDGSLKRCFIPREGYELWEADYSQLELRLGAAYAREQSLIEEFSKPNSDVFTRMALELGFSRGDTKTLTYTLQYGGGINRLCAVFKVSPARAAEIRDNYFDTYPGFRRVTQVASRKAEKQGYVQYWSGRRRHFQYPSESFKAFNSVIQGGSAEVVKRAMLRLQAFGYNDERTGCRMLLQVHDSVVFEIPAGSSNSLHSGITECMVEMPQDFGVKFAIDLHIWGK